MTDVLDLQCHEIVAALDEFAIADTWEIGASIRGLPKESIGLTGVTRGDKPNQAFRNLVVGTIAEGVFRSTQLVPLEAFGFNIIDYREAGDNRDFGLTKDGLELPINVKTASTIFRNAKTTVGLDPEDCIPVSAYKALGAIDHVPDLVYADLVDFNLREKVDKFISSLTGASAVLWDLFSWYAGRGAKKAQDTYITRLFDTHREQLEKLVDPAGKFRTISAKRVIAIMRRYPRRVPGLGIKAAGTGSFNAEVNVHVSVRDETVAWEDVAALVKNRGIEHVLSLIRETASETVPSPKL